MKLLIAAFLLAASVAFAASSKKDTKQPIGIQCCPLWSGQCVCGPIPNPWCTDGSPSCYGARPRRDADPLTRVERGELERYFHKDKVSRK